MSNKRKSLAASGIEDLTAVGHVLSREEPISRSLSRSELAFRANEYYSLYALEEVIDICETGMLLYPEDRRFVELMVKSLYKNQEYHKALQVSMDRLLIDPYHTNMMVLQVRIACKMDRLEQAQGWIDLWSDRLPQEEWGSLYLAQAVLSKHMMDIDGVLFYAQRAISFLPDCHEAFEIYSKAVDVNREYSSAIAFYLTCIDQDPYSQYAWYYLAEAQMSVGQYYEAIQSFEYAYIADPEYIEAYESAAELCAEMGYWRRAILTCLDLETRQELDADHYAMMAKCYLSLNMSKEAGKCLKKLANCDSRHEELYFLIGDRYYSERKWNKAIMAYKIALEGNDQEDEFIFRMARSLSKVGKFNQAIHHFENAVDLGPEQDLYWFVYAKYLIKERRFDLALEVLNRAEESTFSPRLDYLRSILLLKSNQRSAGLTTLSGALQEDSEHLPLIYKFLPEAVNDRQIQSMIQYYSSNYEQDTDFLV